MGSLRKSNGGWQRREFPSIQEAMEVLARAMEQFEEVFLVVLQVYHYSDQLCVVSAPVEIAVAAPVGSFDKKLIDIRDCDRKEVDQLIDGGHVRNFAQQVAYLRALTPQTDIEITAEAYRTIEIRQGRSVRCGRVVIFCERGKATISVSPSR